MTGPFSSSLLSHGSAGSAEDRSLQTVHRYLGVEPAMKLAALTKAKRTMNHTVYWATNLRWYLKKCLKVKFHFKVLFLRFYVLYMPVV